MNSIDSWKTSVQKQDEKCTIKNNEGNYLEWILNLKEQCGITKFSVNSIPTNQLAQWQEVTSSLPNNNVNFGRRYLTYCHGTNL